MYAGAASQGDEVEGVCAGAARMDVEDFESESESESDSESSGSESGGGGASVVFSSGADGAPNS